MHHTLQTANPNPCALDGMHLTVNPNVLRASTIYACRKTLNRGTPAGQIPAFGGDYTHVVGSIIFNYAYAAFIPSWVNEKKPEVCALNPES